jgi:hypothetical protein
MEKGALFSNCKKYRYTLCRIWNRNKSYAVFIGLNPSVADANIDDPTIRRCIKYAKDWNLGGLYMLNLFSYIATNPKVMKNKKYPIGKLNDKWLLKISKDAGIIIGAWGNDGSHLMRSKSIKKLIPNLYCLKINNTGEPAHPLYQKANIIPSLLK